MTRECNKDFSLYIKYISEYKIVDNLNHKPYLASAKSMHKAYFSLINWHVEYQHQMEYFKVKYTSNTDILLRLSEAVSDIGASKFNWLNGSYKASRVMLRSSIENFVRAISAIENESQIQEKSVYSLLDKAKDSDIFNSSEHVNASYKALHLRYKELCKDTHTSSCQNMDQITSLVDYPKYIEDKSQDTDNIFISVVKNILIILCLSFNDLYHKMHHRNKENIINSIPRLTRPFVLAPPSE